MPKKKTNKENPKTLTNSDERTRHLSDLKSLLSTLHSRRCIGLRNRTTYSGPIYSGTTNSWLTESMRCRTHRYPQLVKITPADSDFYFDYGYYCSPPTPKHGSILTLLKSTLRPSGYYSGGDYTYNLMLTGVSNPALMVYVTHKNYWEEKYRKYKRYITHKSTEIDPYDANSQVMKLKYVLRSKDSKYYALSSQGALFVMEETDGNQIVITGICGTRAVPSSESAKFFREYLFESRGDILLAFLIYKESTKGLADEIEVYKDTLKLVKLDRLNGRSLFLENECCVWVDSEEVGCKGDCVYFTGGSGDGWWMYDMKTGSISDECVEMPGIQD